MRSFWAEADRIIRSTRLPHETGFDAERERLAREAARRRHQEMVADGTAPPPTIEISGA